MKRFSGCAGAGGTVSFPAGPGKSFCGGPGGEAPERSENPEG